MIHNIPSLINDHQYYKFNVEFDQVALRNTKYILPKNCKKYQGAELCQYLPELSITNNSRCEIKIISNFQNFDNCVKQIHEIRDVEIQYLHDLILIIAPIENEIREECDNIIKTKFIKGVYYIEPKNECKYQIKDHKIQNYNRKVPLQMYEFLEYSHYYQNISNVTLKEISYINVKNELNEINQNLDNQPSNIVI